MFMFTNTHTPYSCLISQNHFHLFYVTSWMNLLSFLDRSVLFCKSRLHSKPFKSSPTFLIIHLDKALHPGQWIRSLYWERALHGIPSYCRALHASSHLDVVFSADCLLSCVFFKHLHTDPSLGFKLVIFELWGRWHKYWDKHEIHCCNDILK